MTLFARVMCLVLASLLVFNFVPLKTASALPGNADMVSQIITDKDRYNPGEPVNIVVRLWNIGSQTLSLSFGSDPKDSFVVEDLNGTQLYDVRQHMTVLAVVTYLTLLPGEFQDYNYTWLQVDDAGKPVNVPNYFVIRPKLGNVMEEINVVTVPRNIAVSTSYAVAASFSISSTSNKNGSYPATVQVNANASTGLANGISGLQFRWDWDWNRYSLWGTNWSANSNAKHTYTKSGTYTVKLEVMDTIGLSNQTTEQVVVYVGSSGKERAPISLPLLVGATAAVAVLVALAILALYLGKKRKTSP